MIFHLIVKNVYLLNNQIIFEIIYRAHNKGIVYKVGCEVEKIYPKVKVWKLLLLILKMLFGLLFSFHNKIFISNEDIS